jgi:hypothetical protein
MGSAAPTLAPPLEAIVLVAGAVWLTLGPQIPLARRRRGLLALLTWAGSRAWLAWLAHANPWAIAGPLVADFVAWRALADAYGEDGEAAWGWAATPMVAMFMLRAGPGVAYGAAAVALALALLRRGLDLPAGFALGSAVAIGGPWAAIATLPFALAFVRSPLRLAALLVPVLGALTMWWGHANDAAWPAHLELPAAGTGPTLWRVPAALGLAPGALVGWALAGAVAVYGAARLGRAGAGALTFGAWGFCVLAALAPGTSSAHLLAWMPFLCAWCADDPDRRGWWVIEGLALPLALVLEAGPLRGEHGPLWHYLALAGILGCAALALWPLHALSTGPVATPERAAH